MICADTNILVYATDLDDSERNAVALQLLTDATSAERLALTEQSLFEFLNVSINKRRQMLAKVVEIIDDWTAVLPIIRPDHSIFEETVVLLERYRLSVWDARLLATCAMHACEFLFSEDMQDGALYGTVQVINPFNPDNGALVRELVSA